MKFLKTPVLSLDLVSKHLNPIELERRARSKLGVFWLYSPILAVITLLAIYSSLTHGNFSKTAYLSSQQSWFMGMNSTLNQAPGSLWENLTLLGDGFVIFPLFSIVLIWSHKTWLSMWASIPFAALFSAVGKSWFTMPRPASYLPHDGFTILGDTVSAHTSFPSGHSITIFTGLVAVTCSLLPSIRARQHGTLLTLVLGFGLIVCFSRVAVGAHWPMDTLIGASLGWIAGTCGYLWANSRYSSWTSNTLKPGSRSGKAMGIVMLFWSLSLMQQSIDSQFTLVVPLLAAFSGIIASLILILTTENAYVGSEYLED